MMFATFVLNTTVGAAIIALLPELSVTKQELFTSWTIGTVIGMLIIAFKKGNHDE